MKSFRIGSALIAAAAMGMALTPVTPSTEKAISAEAPKPMQRQKKQRAPNPMSWGRTSNLNRSRKWKYAATYADARAISPFPARPVR